MKRLLNTLYITYGNRYLSLDGENVVVMEDKKEIGRIPLHNLQAIVTFGYTGASPALMGACAQRNIELSFMSGNGRFLARVSGEEKGNVTLRQTQSKSGCCAWKSVPDLHRSVPGYLRTGFRWSAGLRHIR